MKLVVQTTDRIADGVVRLRFGAAGGGTLPPFRAGAHLRFTLPAAADGTMREYSIVRGSGGSGDGDFYEVAVLLDSAGRGGSRAMHALVAGEHVDAEGPFNAFALSDKAAHHVLIAGGIGITPILSMATELQAGGHAFELHYAARSRQRMAFAPEVAAMPGTALYHSEDGAHARMPVAAILDKPAPGRHVYVCGPQSLIADVVETARQRGWPDEQIHFEAFKGAVSLRGDQPIRLELRASRRTIVVQAQESILDAMVHAGMDPLHDCRRGECGMCMVPVLEGVPDHRDHALTDAEKASGKVICTCVSRARTPVLVLDF